MAGLLRSDSSHIRDRADFGHSAAQTPHPLHQSSATDRIASRVRDDGGIGTIDDAQSPQRVQVDQIHHRPPDAPAAIGRGQRARSPSGAPRGHCPSKLARTREGVNGAGWVAASDQSCGGARPLRLRAHGRARRRRCSCPRGRRWPNSASIPATTASHRQQTRRSRSVPPATPCWCDRSPAARGRCVCRYTQESTGQRERHGVFRIDDRQGPGVEKAGGHLRPAGRRP